jgi:hypothetical protein
MEFICNDIDGKTPWHYCTEEKTYYRDFKENRHQGKIKGKDIPNPTLLEQKRMDFLNKAKAGGAKIMDQDWAKAKASPTTHRLFEHWVRINKNA